MRKVFEIVEYLLQEVMSDPQLNNSGTSKGQSSTSSQTENQAEAGIE